MKQHKEVCPFVLYVSNTLIEQLCLTTAFAVDITNFNYMGGPLVIALTTMLLHTNISVAVHYRLIMNTI